MIDRARGIVLAAALALQLAGCETGEPNAIRAENDAQGDTQVRDLMDQDDRSARQRPRANNELSDDPYAGPHALLDRARSLEITDPSVARATYQRIVVEYPTLTDSENYERALSFREEAEDRIKYLDCVDAKPTAVVVDDVREFLDLVLASLKNKDGELLRDLSRCDFDVGVTNSDDLRIERIDAFAHVLFQSLDLPDEAVELVQDGSIYDEGVGQLEAFALMDRRSRSDPRPPRAALYLNRSDANTYDFKHVFWFERNVGWQVIGYSTTSERLDEMRSRIRAYDQRIQRSPP